MRRLCVFLFMVLIVAGWSTSQVGCNLPQATISASERAYSLVAGLNASSRESMADNFLPTINDFPILMDETLYPAVWDPNFPYANAPYTIALLDTSNPAAVTMRLSAGTGTWGPMDLVLAMDLLGNDWYIRELRMDLAPTFPVVTVIVD